MGMKSPRSNRASDDARLLSSPQIYSMIVNNLPIGFSLVDRDGIILEFNPAAFFLKHLYEIKMIKADYNYYGSFGMFVFYSFNLF